MTGTQNYIREFFVIFFMRKKIIIGVTVAFTIIALLIAFFWPPIYAAKGSILVLGKKRSISPEALETLRLDVPQVRETDLFSEMQIMTSYGLIEKTVLFLQQKGLIFRNDQTPEDIRARIFETQGKIEAEPVPRSNTFNVILKWRDPQEAETLLQNLMDQYLDYRAGLYSPKEAEEFFRQQLANFNDNLTKMENNLLKLAEESGSPNPEKVIDANLLIEENLRRELDSLRNEWIRTKTYVEDLKGIGSSSDISFFTYIDNPAIQDFGKKLQDLFIEKESLLKAYHPQSEKIKRIQEEIDNVYQALKKEMRGYLSDQKSRLKGMEAAIRSFEDRLKRLSSNNVELFKNNIETKRIRREIDLLENSYNTFAKRWEEARIDLSTGANRLFSVSILSKPYASRTPIFPNKNIVIPMGILIGFILGITVGFLQEFFNHTFKRPEDVKNYTDFQTLFSIPHSDRAMF